MMIRLLVSLLMLHLTRGLGSRIAMQNLAPLLRRMLRRLLLKLLGLMHLMLLLVLLWLLLRRLLLLVLLGLLLLGASQAVALQCNLRRTSRTRNQVAVHVSVNRNIRWLGRDGELALQRSIGRL